MAESDPLEFFGRGLEWVALFVEAAGVAVIVAAAVVAILAFFTHWRTGGGIEDAYHIARTSLARGILLGIEFLVAADIVQTVILGPSLENLAVLAGVVLIRTFLSFSLEVEIEGRWPWQRHGPSRATISDLSGDKRSKE